VVDQKKSERAKIQSELNTLLKEREDYIATEKRRLAAAGKGDSFDEKVNETLRQQAARKGIRYE
jgi:hypothetical protein